MAQPPFRSDAYEVENADAPTGPRLIEADENDGSLRFTDTRITGGINLNELVGLQQAQNTLIVSQTGEGGSKDANGDPITTLQGALDNIPVGADVDNPWTIVMAPGLYIEDVYLVKDGVTIEGLGTVILRNASAVSTIRVRAGVSTVPRRVAIQNVRIENVSAAQACIDLSSATFASGTITIASVPNVGDIAEVGGVNFMAIANGSVPAPGEFELGVDEATTAANLVTAIADPVNGLTGVVVPSSSGTVVTIRALDDGVAGNAITLSSTVALVIVVSGPTLTGGLASAPGSTVGNDLIQVRNCDLVPTIAGSFTLRAAAINNLYVEGGNWDEAATGTTFSVIDCASCTLVGVSAEAVVLDYDNTNVDLPSIATSSYEMRRVQIGGIGLLAGYTGVGSLTMTDCTVVGTTTYSGSAPAQSLTATRCSFGPLTVGGLVPTITLSNCTRGALTAGGGTGTMQETRAYGSAAFVAVPSVTVPFDPPQPNTSYQVHLEYDGPPAAITDIPTVPTAAKMTTSFDITYGAAQTTVVNYTIVRDI
jgi:hypothetical protein